MPKKIKKEYIEDSTKYGEFVCSEFGWITPDEQKKIVSKLEGIGERNKEKK